LKKYSPVEVEGGVVGFGGRLQEQVVGGDALDAAPRAHAQPQVVLGAQARGRGAHQRHLLGRRPLALHHFAAKKKQENSQQQQPLHSSNAFAQQSTPGNNRCAHCLPVGSQFFHCCDLLGLRMAPKFKSFLRRGIFCIFAHL